MTILESAQHHVAQLLHDNSFGDLGTTLFYDEWGPSDAQVLVLAGTGTGSDLPETYEEPGVQILVRGAKKGNTGDAWGYTGAAVYAVAKGVSDFLLAQLDTLQINGVGYRGFEEASTLSPLGRDDKQRFIYSANFYTWRNRT